MIHINQLFNNFIKNNLLKIVKYENYVKSNQNDITVI